MRSVPAVKQSVWSDLHFEVHQAKQSQSSDGSKLPKKPFSVLYRLIQDRTLACTGMIGPLALFGAASYCLFVAYAATTSPRVHFPSTWSSVEVACQLFGAAAVIETRLATFGLRIVPFL